MRQLLLSLFFLSAAVACKVKPQDEGPATDRPLRFLATTGMIGDALENIVPDGCEVDVLMGPGVDPHLYRPAQSDLDRLDRADVIVVNGLHLEGKMQDLFEDYARTKKVIFLGELLPEDRLRSDPQTGVHDPHIWFDVALWADGVDRMVGTLSAYDTAHAKVYQERGVAYLKTLRALHEEIKATMGEIPESQRYLVTAHDAFGYFGSAYGVEVHGIQGISTISEPSLQQMMSLADQIVARKVPAIFVESSVPEKQVRVLIEACEKKGHKVTLGGTLYSDAMGAVGTGAETYEGMVRANVKTLRDALGKPVGQ